MTTHASAEASSADDTKEPSFEGRLQLKDFMFAPKENVAGSPTMRRSPRLSAPISDVAAASVSPSRSPLARASPTRPQGRKRKDDATPSGASARDSPSPAKRSKKSSGYAPPSTYAHLSLLPDVIAPDLLILFIGLNPGVQTARSGHAYAHPSNLFWKLLYSSGITPERCTAEEDRTLPARFALGNTNIVARPSRNGAELSKAEMDAGVAILEEKCARWRPEVVCVVGKSIWESIFRVRNGRSLAKGEFEYGWQEGQRMGVVDNEATEETHDGSAAGAAEDAKSAGVDLPPIRGPWEGSKIFVATSTSGLAATVRPAEKERIWKILGDWCMQRRKEKEDLEAPVSA